MKILITGGCGFIGSHTADRFYKEGHEIFIIDNLCTGKRENVKVKHKFYNLNVADRSCEEIFKINRFDIVINLSAQVDVKTSMEHPYADSKSNLLGITNLLDLSTKYGAKKFIFASSAAVYGNTNIIPVSEETPKDPISPYGMSKSVGEFYSEKWREIYGLNTMCFRFSNVYGPRQGLLGEAGVISIFMQKIINNKEITIFGDGEQTRDFIYVEDVAFAIYKAALCNSCMGVVNLSTNTEQSLNKMVEILGQLHAIKSLIYKERKNGDILNSSLDNSKVKGLLDWEPMYSFKEGIEKTYNWYVENRDILEVHDQIEYKDFKNEKYNFKNFIPHIENIFICASGLLYIAIFLNLGGDVINFSYEPTDIIQLVLYLLLGVVAVYSIEKKKKDIYAKELQLSSLTQKYEFLEGIYNETRLAKEELQKQVDNAH